MPDETPEVAEDRGSEDAGGAVGEGGYRGEEGDGAEEEVGCGDTDEESVYHV